MRQPAPSGGTRKPPAGSLGGRLGQPLGRRKLESRGERSALPLERVLVQRVRCWLARRWPLRWRARGWRCWVGLPRGVALAQYQRADSSQGIPTVPDAAARWRSELRAPLAEPHCNRRRWEHWTVLWAPQKPAEAVAATRRLGVFQRCRTPVARANWRCGSEVKVAVVGVVGGEVPKWGRHPLPHPNLRLPPASASRPFLPSKPAFWRGRDRA